MGQTSSTKFLMGGGGGGVDNHIKVGKTNPKWGITHVDKINCIAVANT